MTIGIFTFQVSNLLIPGNAVFIALAAADIHQSLPPAAMLSTLY